MSLFQMPGTAPSLAWSDAQVASRRRCRGTRGALEAGAATPQDAVDPPLRYLACSLSEEPSTTLPCSGWPAARDALPAVRAAQHDPGEGERDPTAHRG